MKKIALALFALFVATLTSQAQEKPMIWQNPAPLPSDVEARLKYLESNLGIYRLGWTCRVPRGYTVVMKFHAAGEKAPQLTLTYDGNKIPQPRLPDIFVASAPDTSAKDRRTLTFGDSRDTATVTVNGTMRVHAGDVKPDKKFNLFEVFLANSKAPQYWCEVEFQKTP